MVYIVSIEAGLHKLSDYERKLEFCKGAISAFLNVFKQSTPGETLSHPPKKVETTLSSGRYRFGRIILLRYVKEDLGEKLSTQIRALIMKCNSVLDLKSIIQACRLRL